MPCNPRDYARKPDFEEGDVSILCSLFGHDVEYYDDYPYFTITCVRCHATGRTSDRIFACSKNSMRKLLTKRYHNFRKTID